MLLNINNMYRWIREILGISFTKTTRVLPTSYIKKDCFKSMYEHCEKEAMQHEVIGFLIGDRFVSESIPYVYVLDTVSGSYKSNQVHVQFTQEGLLEVSSKLEALKTESRCCPIDNHQLLDGVCTKCHYNICDIKTVGWYHSHPGHTAFMSGTDLSTQRNYQFDISIVIDPINREFKVFQEIEGELQPVDIYETD